MAHQSTIDAYNKIAEEFHSRNSSSFYTEEYKIFKDFLRGRKILEIGCGTGRDAKNLIDLDYTGVDASVGMLGVAKKMFRTVIFLLVIFIILIS